jgi:signal transduction histidine kinase
MRSLTLRIYLAVVAVLLLFAVVAGWVAQRNLDHDRETHRQGMAHERFEALGELIENSLPNSQAPRQAQAQALLELSDRLRVPMALDDAQGQRIAQAPVFEAWLKHHPQPLQVPERVAKDVLRDGVYRHVWADGRVLWLLRPPRPILGGNHGPPSRFHSPSSHWLPFMPWLPANFLLVLLLLFVAVALGAWPVARHLTRRLKALRQGVERFGDGQLEHRVPVHGRDEVADLARSFNQAANQIEALIGAHRSLLANASHELRSPLARLKMAVSLMGEAPPERVVQLKREIHQNIDELDVLVEEVLLTSRLDADAPLHQRPVDVLGLLAQEAQHVQAVVHAAPTPAGVAATALTVHADERLLRRAVRNLLENAKRYGERGRADQGAAGAAAVEVSAVCREGWLDIVVQDRGPGVPVDQQERIFEPFYRLPGHAEHAGGVGLGLSLVRQIAKRHGGTVQCEPREGGGSRFIISLPHKNKPGRSRV